MIYSGNNINEWRGRGRNLILVRSGAFERLPLHKGVRLVAEYTLRSLILAGKFHLLLLGCILQIQIQKGYNHVKNAYACLSPTLCNIYLDDMIGQWKVEISPGINLHPAITRINTLLFADDQVILQKS